MTKIFSVLEPHRRHAGRVARSASAALFLAVSLLAVADRPAAAVEGSFAGLAGSWTGAGTVSLSNGGRERIRCRATYAVGSSGNSLEQSLRCASDSYHFELRSNVNASGGAISGSWSEATRNVNGNISGRIRGNQIDALVEANGFSASITIVTNGGRQSVSIRSPGKEFSGAAISLSRS
jgi:hypothetical protein